LENQLLGLGFNIIDRTDLDRIRAEQHLGKTGEIDDHTAVCIGHFVGTSVIVTGVVGSVFVPF